MNLTKLKLVAGTQWNWTENLSSYPATDYTLRISFYKNSSNTFTVVSAASGNTHEFDVAEIQNDVEAGSYIWQAIAVNNSTHKKYIVNQGKIYISANLQTSEDPRGEWTTIHENLKTAYKELCKSPMATINIEGKSYTYADREALLSQLLFAESKANAENGSGNTNRIHKGRFR